MGYLILDYTVGFFKKLSLSKTVLGLVVNHSRKKEGRKEGEKKRKKKNERQKEINK